jgi:cysteine-rich repeat protein
MSRLLLPLLGAGLAATACNVFDPALYQNVQTQDAAPADAGPDGARVAAFVDRCEEATALPAASSMSFDIDTTNFKGDYSELVACAGHDLPGNDAFVAVQMAVGEKWHVHVNPLSTGFDPAVYVLASCDERACSRMTAIDECGPNKSEHLSFVAPQNGTYFIGVDSVSGGGMANVQIFRPTCGNGVVEHSETCDDNNTSSGDGCDSLCRKELSAAAVTEVEPNDDPRAANVLLLPSHPGTITANGMLATRCDHDMYSITVAQLGTVRATVGQTTIACGAEGATISLTLVGGDGQTAVPNVTTSMVGDCPMIEAMDLPPGEYFLVLKRSAGEMSWPYQMMVEGP